jgi:hypothetical protein
MWAARALAATSSDLQRWLSDKRNFQLSYWCMTTSASQDGAPIGESPHIALRHVHTTSQASWWKSALRRVHVHQHIIQRTALRLAMRNLLPVACLLDINLVNARSGVYNQGGHDGGNDVDHETKY